MSAPYLGYVPPPVAAWCEPCQVGWSSVLALFGRLCWCCGEDVTKNEVNTNLMLLKGGGHGPAIHSQEMHSVARTD